MTDQQPTNGIIRLIRRGPAAIPNEGGGHEPAPAVARLTTTAPAAAARRLPPGHDLAALPKWSYTDGTEWAAYHQHDPATCWTAELPATDEEPGDTAAIAGGYNGPIGHCRRCGIALFPTD